MDAFKWKGDTGSDGLIVVDRDENGLPVLRILVPDDHYNGTVDHRTLFRLITHLATLTK